MVPVLLLRWREDRISIEPCDPAFQGERFVQERVGLHHLCQRSAVEDQDASG